MKRRILRRIAVSLTGASLIFGIVGFSGTRALAYPAVHQVVTSSYVKLISEHEGQSDLARQETTCAKSCFQVRKLGPRKQAWYLLPQMNKKKEYSCLNNVIMRESSWNVYAENPSSGAYGIPQALPGDKMAGWMYNIHRDGTKAGKWYYGWRWRNASYVQLFWMIRKYIPVEYRTACGAWYHEQRYGWY